GPETEEHARRAADIRAQVARLKDKALAAGGLYVLGTERHESRRIDNQLRGRSGRPGDPGHSKFFLSLEDDLMPIFRTDNLDTMLQRLGLKENEAIVHSWINKALEKAQQKVEARNFDIRKNLLKFDNVMNDQRKVIFDQRIEWMRDEEVNEIVADMRHAAIEDLVAKHVPENAYPEQWDTKGLREELKRILDLDLPVDEWAKEEGIADEELLSRIERRADEHMASKVAQWGADVMRYVEKSILLQTLDHLWREHLVMLEHLRQVIGLRGYGQRDPLNEYKAESFNLFESMSANLREAVTSQLMRVEIRVAPPEEPASLPYMEAHKIDPSTGEDELALARAGAETLARHGITAAAAAPERNPSDPSSWGKVGRNEACPCGSGKKYKHCHGRFAYADDRWWTIDDGRNDPLPVVSPRAWSSVPGAEPIVEAAGGLGRGGTAEQARSAPCVFLRLGVRFLFRRRGFGRRIRGFGLCRRRLGLRPGRAGGALPALRPGGGGFRFRRGRLGGLSRARVLGLGAEQIAEEAADSTRTPGHRRGDLHRRTRPGSGLGLGGGKAQRARAHRLGGRFEPRRIDVGRDRARCRANGRAGTTVGLHRSQERCGHAAVHAHLDGDRRRTPADHFGGLGLVAALFVPDRVGDVLGNPVGRAAVGRAELGRRFGAEHIALLADVDLGLRARDLEIVIALLEHLPERHMRRIAMLGHVERGHLE